MTYFDFLMDDLVAANRIMAREEVVDGLGHISVRHPDEPGRYFMSRARAPECIERADIMEFDLAGTPISPEGRSPYHERYIHAAIYAARPDVRSVVHSHSHAVIPFSVTGERLRPVHHICSGIGACVPVYDPQKRWGDTDILVTDMVKGNALAEDLGKGTSALLLGHGGVFDSPCRVSRHPSGDGSPPATGHASHRQADPVPVGRRDQPDLRVDDRGKNGPGH